MDLGCWMRPGIKAQKRRGKRRSFHARFETKRAFSFLASALHTNRELRSNTY